MIRKEDVVITPADWENRAKSLSRTSCDLLNLVGWFGSTHQKAMWRKAGEFLNVFAEEGVAGFDPQVTGDWQASYAAIEAEVMASASVILIRLENNELTNGSLGSIAETGLALTSAALRGQIVLISIEEGLLTTLDEPGAIAQYMMLEMFLDQLLKHPVLAPFLRIHRGDDLIDLAELACDTAQEQARLCQSPLDFEQFLTKKARRDHNYPRRVVLGGSGGPYADAYKDTFQQKKDHLLLPYRAEGHVLKVLSEGAIATAWDIPYGSPNPLGTALAMRALLSIEFEFKQEADLLLLPIIREAASKAAATEIGFLLLYALTTGQDVRIYFEPFDPVDYLRFHLNEVALRDKAGEKQVRTALRQAGVADATLATAVQREVEEAYRLLRALGSDEPPAFKAVKGSLLGQTPAFRDGDNIRRVRFLVKAHLEKIVADHRFPDFFHYSDQIYWSGC